MRGEGTLPAGAAGWRSVGAAVLAVAMLVATGCIGARTAPSQSWSGVTVADGMAYVGTRQGDLVAFDLERQGRIVSSFQAPAAGRTDAFPGFYSAPTVVGEVVYAAGFDGTVYALDAAHLQTVENRANITGDELSEHLVGSVVVSNGRLIVGAQETADTGRLYVFDEDLRETCTFPAPGAAPIGPVWTTPAVVNGVAYFGDLAHGLYAVDVATCEALWPKPADLGGGIVATPLIIGNTAYLGTFGRTFYAVNLETGTPTALFNADNWFWASAATDGTRIFAPSLDGHLYAMDLETRSIAWIYPRQEDIGAIISAPVVVGDLVVVASDDENLVVLESDSGQRTWDQRVGARVRAPLGADGNVVFVHGLDERVRAYDVVERDFLWERDVREDR